MVGFIKQVQGVMSGLWPDMLRSVDIPDRLIVRPVDVWQGDKTKGALLCNGTFSCYGKAIELHGECWEPVTLSEAELQYLHGFEWLRDLRAEGSAAAAQQARALTQSWMQHYTKPMAHRARQQFSAWDMNLMGKRLALWVSHFDFFAAEDDPDFQDQFFESLYRQSVFLGKELCAYKARLDAGKMVGGYGDVMPAAKGLLFCGLGFEGHEMWVHMALDMIHMTAQQSLSKSGLHVSRSPYMTLRFLRNLVDARAALQAGGHPVPPWMQDLVQKIAPVVRFFRFADKHFSLQHGAMCSDFHYIDDVLAQSAVKGRRLKSLSADGYTKLSVGRSLAMFDHGNAAQHCAPLSFEFAYGKDRIFTHCGSHQTDPMWQEMLAQPSAHNCALIDGDVLNFGYKPYGFETKTEAEFAFARAQHDGFVADTGLAHARQIYLGQDGHDVRGEDVFIAKVPLAKPHSATIRFHIHPSVMVSVVQDGTQILLRLPSGVGWRFRQVGGRLSLEESLYAGTVGALPQKTHQIVIYTTLDSDENTVKWALQREGL